MKYPCFAALTLALCSSVSLAAEAVAPQSENDKAIYSLGWDLGTELKDNALELNQDLLLQGIKDAMEGKLTYAEEEEDPTADTPRIRHVAWLAHRMLPWSFEQAGEDFPETGIRVELMGPRYARWVYGPEDAPDVIKGVAGEWCRIAVHRLDSGATSLKAEGDKAELALKVVRTY